MGEGSTHWCCCNIPWRWGGSWQPPNHCGQAWTMAPGHVDWLWKWHTPPWARKADWLGQLRLLWGGLWKTFDVCPGDPDPTLPQLQQELRGGHHPSQQSWWSAFKPIEVSWLFNNCLVICSLKIWVFIKTCKHCIDELESKWRSHVNQSCFA